MPQHNSGAQGQYSICFSQTISAFAPVREWTVEYRGNQPAKAVSGRGILSAPPSQVRNAPCQRATIDPHQNAAKSPRTGGLRLKRSQHRKPAKTGWRIDQRPNRTCIQFSDFRFQNSHLYAAPASCPGESRCPSCSSWRAPHAPPDERTLAIRLLGVY